MITIEQKTMVVAKAFFDDMQGDDDYEFGDVNEQYEELIKQIKEGEISIHFINAVYEMNK